MRGGFAAPRRPRSGFKESSQGCENEDSALNDLKRSRERSRKERKVLGSSSSGRRNKKTRTGLGEQLYRGSDDDDGYETVEVSHCGSPVPSHSHSEEDEEGEEDVEEAEGEEPRFAINPRRPANTKLKSHKLSDDIIGAGLSSIPRKARSAFVKRPHESSPSAPPSDGPGLQPCLTAPSQSIKPGRRTKPPGTKPRPAKFAKVSASFSEREVEVAEVLFGFAKQFTSESCVEDANELKTSPPIRNSSPVSASPSSLPPPAEASKRKRPRVAVKPEDVRSPTPTTVEQACKSTEMDNFPLDNVDVPDGLVKGFVSVPSTTADSPQNYVDFVQVSNPCLPSVQKHGVLDRKTLPTSETLIAPLPAEKKAGTAEKVDGVNEFSRNEREPEDIDAPADMSHSPDSTEKIDSTNISPQSSKAEDAPAEKLEIDLMASPLKETVCLDKEDNDNGPNVAENAVAELPVGGTVGVGSVLELEAVGVKQVIEEKREEGVEEGERQKGDCKRENGGERGIKQHHIKEENIDGNNPGDIVEERDKDSSKQLPQKLGKITKTDSRTQMPDRSDISSSLVSVPGNINSIASVAESLPLSMAVASWHGGLSTLGYFGPSSATWPGAPSLPGVMPVEANSTSAPTMQPGFILPPRQTLKRCATHADIAHFIEYQKQLARQPFWATTYGSSGALYGVKPYNLNIPLPPPRENILGGSLLGTMSASSVRNSETASHNIMGSSLNDGSIGQNSKEKVATAYMDVLQKHPLQQQAAQQTSSTALQHASPFGFPITESGSSCSAAVNAGNGSPMNGRNLGSRPSSFHVGGSTTSVGGTATVHSSFASMASAAQAQYLAMLQQNGYPYPLPHAHFGATNTGAHHHLGHQQILNGSFYGTHLIHPPLQPQQQGQQNPNTTSGFSSSQKQQQQFNFSSLQQQTPSNSPHHHLFPSSQSVQVEHDGSKGGDGASGADRKPPMAQKSFCGQGTPSSSNSNINPSSLLVATLPMHTQDLTLMAGLGVKHPGLQQPVSMQHQGADPSLHMSWKGQHCNQNGKQAAGRAKTTAHSTVSNYSDHVASAANHSNFQESCITNGQNLKQQQHDQQSPQWKVPSNIITSVGAASQAVMAAAMRNLPQQGPYQPVSSNSMANSPVGAIPQAVFATSTKSFGQQPRNQPNNPSSSLAPNSKSAGTPASKTASGNKGSTSRSQRSIAPMTGKKSSPNHISQSSSSKSSQKQYEQQQKTSAQAAVSAGSGQAVSSKNQQYYSQAHFNQQQSYQLQKQSLPHQIQQQLLFSQNQYIHQQAIQQSQLSAQPAQQAVVLHQQPPMQGFNYSQPSFSNPTLRQQEQQQQILSVSSTPSSLVCSETLSVGLPTLTLGGASSGRGPAKIMPGGSLRDNGTGASVLHTQYSPFNGTVSAQAQSGNSQAILTSHYMQTVPTVSRKFGEQKVVSDSLNQDQVNGVLLLPNAVDLNMCAQTNSQVNTSSIQSSSIRMTTGSLKKAQGVNIVDSMSTRGLNVSAIPSGHGYQDLGVSSGQTPSLSMQQPPLSIGSGHISSALSTPLEAAASIDQP